MKTKFNLNKVFLFTAFSVLFTLNSTKAQVKVKHQKDANKLVREVLIGNGVTVSNIILRGDTLSTGVFSSTGTALGLDSGIVITTGSVYEIPDSAKVIASSVASPVGDGDLNSLLVLGQTKDAASLQFQFVPTSDKVAFNIIFASEEYPDFIGDQFLSNDILGIFLSGPGISGKKNIAVIPGTDEPISIKSINENIRSNLYVNNLSGSQIVYNGFTQPITIVADDLQSCETYTIKIAIADVDDQAYNSAVFIEAESFSSETPNDAFVARVYPTGFPVDSVEEKCDSALFDFIRSSNDLTKNLTVKFSLTGAATLNVDYTSSHIDSIVIPAGTDRARLTIFPIDDNITEANEDVQIDITSNSVCAASGASVLVSDFDSLKIVSFVEIDCKGDTVIYLVKTSGGSDRLSYVWTDSLGAIVGASPVIEVSPDSLTRYIVTIYDSCINVFYTDTLYVPPITKVILTTQNDTIVCAPTVLSLLVNSSQPGMKFLWTAQLPSGQSVGFFNNDTIPNPTYAVPSGFTEIIVTVEIDSAGFCAKPASFKIRTIPKGIASRKPALICGNGTVQLQAFGGETYRWRPSSGLNDSTIANPIASEERTYTVSITDSIGCVADFSIQVIIDTLPIANAGQDKYICERESIVLQASGSEYNTYEWSPRNSLSKYNIANPIATPAVTTTYILKAINNACIDYDTVTIYVIEVPVAGLEYTFDSCAKVLALSNKTIGTDSVYWDFGDGTNSLEKNPIHKFDSTGSFTVQLIANRNTDCSDTATVQITIPELDINKRRIPNVFTPNGDGKNDNFRITGGNVECLLESISIYNRWGKLLYEIKDQTSWEWDGRVGGEIVPPGVYFYAVKGKGFEDVGSFSVIY